MMRREALLAAVSADSGTWWDIRVGATEKNGSVQQVGYQSGLFGGIIASSGIAPELKSLLYTLPGVPGGPGSSAVPDGLYTRADTGASARLTSTAENSIQFLSEADEGKVIRVYYEP